MEILFLGTKGYIDLATRRHKKHTSTLILYNNQKIMIDCGIDWGKKVWSIKPDAIIITHAHPDHAGGLKDGAPCNVWATSDSWQIMNKYKIDFEFRKLIRPRIIYDFGGLKIEAFSEVHSINAPAVGYRIEADKNIIYYTGDVVYIKERKEALKNVQLYIGDGATIIRPMIRKHKVTGELFGHAPISTQLTWCKKENVPAAIITHCGSQIVQGGIKANSKIKSLAKARNIKVKIAYDGMKIKLK